MNARLAKMQRRSDILALVLAGAVLTLCELLVVQVVETTHRGSMDATLGAMYYHIPRNEFGHRGPQVMPTMVRCCHGDRQ